MKHSYGLTIGLHFRQPDYTRGQSALAWVLSFQRGSYTEGRYPPLSAPGGHEKRRWWARLTLFGVSLQVGVEHAASNWSRPKRAAFPPNLPQDRRAG